MGEDRSSTSTTMPQTKRIVMDEDQKRAFNEKIRNFLGAKYSQRPKADVAYVEPTLFNVAHEIISTKEGNTIYLGPKSAASLRALDALHKAGIIAICNITTCVPCYHRQNNIKYCEVAINDESGADILTYFHGATTFLHHVMHQNEGGSVLVHCEQGISRSASIVIAYLMRFHQMTRDEAYVLCKSKRPMINPNEGFWNQLEDYEKALLTTTQQHENKNAGRVEDANVVFTMTTEPFDSTWALRSSALYSTCREIMANHSTIARELSCHRIANLNSREEINHLLFVSLDFVWGRGILDVDLDWFVNVVCRNISPSEHSRVFEQVKHMLTDPESKFSQIWCGEIYQEQIDKVLKAINR